MSAPAVREKQEKNFPAMLEQFKNEIARALPTHLKADRIARIALTAFRRNPKLADCDPRSVFAAVIQASQLGLEIDTLGRAYLIPYEKKKNVNGEWKVVETECQFVPGWKGLVDLVNRSGNATVWTGAVFEGDEFDYALGDRPFVKHKPGEEFDENLITHVYSVGRVKGSDWPVIEVWSIGRVKKHLKKYNKVGNRHYAHENMEMYARKVVLLQVLKYMPSSPELAQAIALNDAAEIGKQGLNVKDAIEGTWAPVINGEDDKPETEQVFCSPEAFVKQKASWKTLIVSGKKTVADLIAMIESKETLTDEQKFEIDSWKLEKFGESTMIIHSLKQGSDAWHAFRLEHFGASEAAAMLGLSKKVKRDELLHMKKTGNAKEFSEWVQKNILDHGHEVEALARPIIEEEFGIDLYPVTCSEGKHSASCDGLTLDERILYEHKQWSQSLAAAVLQGVLPEEHMPQCQQLLMVTGAEKVMFVVSDGTRGNMVWMEVFRDAVWFDRIIAGWEQFERDLDAYVPVIHAEKPEAEAVLALPALTIQTTGAISVIHNLELFGQKLNEFISKINLEPTDDAGFANAENAAKILRKAEDALEAAEASSLAQTPDVDEMRRLVAMYKETARKMAIALERMAKSRKELIKSEALTKVRALYDAHVKALEKEIQPGAMYCPYPDFMTAAKNKRTLKSLHNELNTTLANGKIAADAAAKEIRAKLAWYNENAKGYEVLFADLKSIILKQKDDFELLVTKRIEQHKFTERKKIEEGARALILAEEQKKAEAAVQAAMIPKQPEPAKPAQIVVKTAPSGTSRALLLRARHELVGIRQRYGEIKEFAGIIREIDLLFAPVELCQLIEDTAHYQAEGVS